MILVNNEESFELFFDGKPFNVPKGRFEVTSTLGSFIIKRAALWGKNIQIEDSSKMKIEQVIVPDTKPVVTPEIKTEDIKEPIKPEDVDGAIEDLKSIEKDQEFLK